MPFNKSFIEHTGIYAYMHMYIYVYMFIYMYIQAQAYMFEYIHQWINVIFTYVSKIMRK